MPKEWRRFSEEDVEYLTENWAKKRPSRDEQDKMAKSFGRTHSSCARKVTEIRNNLGIVTNASAGTKKGPRTPYTKDHIEYLLEHWARKLPTIKEQEMIADHIGHSRFSCRATVTRLRHEHGIDITKFHPEGYVAQPTKAEDKPYLGLMDDEEDCWWNPPSSS